MTVNPDPSVMPVASRCCDRCLFSSRPLVDKTRRQQILAECHQTGRPFVCHKASLRGEFVVCRGFYDRGLSLSVVLAKNLDRARMVENE